MIAIFNAFCENNRNIYKPILPKYTRVVNSDYNKKPYCSESKYKTKGYAVHKPKEFAKWMKIKKMTKQDYLEAYAESKKVDGTLSEELKNRIKGIEKYKEVVGAFADLWNTGQSVFGDGSYIFDIFEQYISEREQLRKLELRITEEGGIPIETKNYREASSHVKKILLDVEKMKMERSKYLLAYEKSKAVRANQGTQNDESKTIEITFEDD